MNTPEFDNKYDGVRLATEVASDVIVGKGATRADAVATANRAGVRRVATRFVPQDAALFDVAQLLDAIT